MEHDEINFIKCLFILRKRIRLVVAVVFFFTVVGMSYSIYAPRIFVAEAVLLKVGGGSSLSSGMLVASQLFGGGLVAGSASNGGSLQFFLKSRSFAERLADVLDLRKEFFAKDWDVQHNKWKDGVKIPTLEDVAGVFAQKIDMKAGKDNLNAFIFTVTDTDPRRATLINKVALQELQKYMRENTFTKHKRYRVYIQEQLVANRKELLQLGKELSDYHNNNAISAVTPLIDVDLNDDLNLTEKRTDFHSNIDKTVKILKKEKAKKDKELAKAVVYNVPEQVYFNYLSQKKQILYELHGLLAQKYELAKMEESKEDLTFKVVDEAREPTAPSKPRVKLIMMLSVFAGFIFACFSAFAVEWIKNQDFSYRNYKTLEKKE